MHESASLGRILRLLGGFTVLSTVAGLLAAGLAIPAIGAAGTAANGIVKSFEDLPADFSIRPLAQQSRILDAKGGLIANPYDEFRIIVPLDRIAPVMQQAILAIEDDRFYQHGGLDVRGLTRASISNLAGGEVQGGSTITQQYVKLTRQQNALKENDRTAAAAAVEQSVKRKVQELKYALDVERNYTKDQILNGYLNLVLFGDLNYGVEAAARSFFGVSAADLNLVQSALLAGVVQRPSTFDPVRNPEVAQRRRDQVLSRMESLGMASPDAIAAAKAVPVKDMIVKRQPRVGTCLRSSDPYFCAYVMEYLQKSPQLAVLGKTAPERLKNINQGGLTIKTTLNPDLQRTTLDELKKAMPSNQPNVGGASTVLEPGTGKVIAMAQTTNFADYQTNLNADQKYGGGPNGYQFGSSAKPWALMVALEKGTPVNSSIDAPRADAGRPYVFNTREMRNDCNNQFAAWPVQNDYASGGRMTLAAATAQSINTAFAKLTIDLGACNVREAMTRSGLHESDGGEPALSLAAVALGAATTTPMTIAASYASWAARGKYCEPTPIEAILNADGKPLEIPGAACKQVTKPEIADGMNELLRGPLKGPRGTARTAWQSDRPAAGKTGTTDGFNQSWFIGYTPQRAGAVWIGNIQPQVDGRYQSLGGKCFGEYGCQRQVFGGTIAAPVWGKIMRAATDGMPPTDFTRPNAQVADGDYRDVPQISGMSVDEARGRIEAAGFTASVGATIDSRAAQGAAAGTNPRGRALAGSAVEILVSSGRTPQPRRTQPPPPPAQNQPTQPIQPQQQQAPPAQPAQPAQGAQPVAPRRAAPPVPPAKPARPTRIPQGIHVHN